MTVSGTGAPTRSSVSRRKQVVDAAHRQLAEGDDQVAFLEPGALGGTARLDADDEDGRLGRQAEVAHDAGQQRHGLAGDPDVAAAHAAIADQPRRDELGGVDGDREADALGGLDDGGVDADHLAARVDQRATGVARVERGVGLNHVFDQPTRAGLQRAAKGADDAGGDGRLEAVRVADGDGDLAGPDGLRVAQTRRAEVGRIQADDRQVGVRVVADERGADAAAVAERHVDLAGAVHDVAVGERKAVGREDEARAAALVSGLAAAGGHGDVDFDD